MKTSLSRSDFNRGFAPIIVIVAVAMLGGFVLFTSVGRFSKSELLTVRSGVLGEQETDNKEKIETGNIREGEELRGSDSRDKEASASQKVKTKLETEHGRLRVKYEIEDGEIMASAENEKGEELELPDEDLGKLEDEVENELEDEGVEIATRGGRLAFSKNKVEATTNFPLSVDLTTNQLVVMTPAGQRTVAVLPDQAIKNLLVGNIINRLATPSASSAGALELKLEDGKMVYEISGSKDFRLFSLIPISAPLKAIVSAENGSLITTELPPLTNLISLFSR